MAIPLAAIGLGTFAAGTLSKVFGQDKDYPSVFGNVQIRNGVAVPSGSIQVLDKGNANTGRLIQDHAVKQLNAAIQSMGLSPEELENLNTPEITVGLLAGGRPGAVSRGGFYFGVMDGGNQFLSGIKSSDQGFQTLDEALNGITNFTLNKLSDPSSAGHPQWSSGEGFQQTIQQAGGVGVVSSAVAAGTGLDIAIPEMYKQSNFWTKIGTAAQVAGAAMGIVGAAQSAGMFASQAGSTAAAGGEGILASSLSGAPGIGEAAAAAINPTFASGITAGAVPVGAAGATGGLAAAISNAVNPTFASGVTAAGTAAGASGVAEALGSAGGALGGASTVASGVAGAANAATSGSGGESSFLQDLLANSGGILKAGEGVLNYMTAQDQQKLLTDYMSQLNDIMTNQRDTNPFTTRALDFYDNFASGGELPDRYKTVLDYVHQASERTGVAQKGGTSQMSGSTANIMAQAVSRTSAEMFNSDLQTLISGIGPSSGMQQTALASMPSILSGLTQAQDKKTQSIGTAAAGALDFLSNTMWK